MKIVHIKPTIREHRRACLIRFLTKVGLFVLCNLLISGKRALLMALIKKEGNNSKLIE